MSFWQARNHSVRNIDNNLRRAGSQASSAPVSAHSPKHVWLHRLERRESCRRGGVRSIGARAREKAAPKQLQSWGQAEPLAHKSRWLPVSDRGARTGSDYVLQKPDRANTHRKPPDCLLV